LKKIVFGLLGFCLFVVTGCSSQPPTSVSQPTNTESMKTLYTSSGVTVLEDLQTGDLIYQTNNGVATDSSVMFSTAQINNLESKGYVPVSLSQTQASTKISSPVDPIKSLYTSNGVTVLEDMQTGDLIYETSWGLTLVSSALFSSNQITNLESKGYVAIK